MQRTLEMVLALVEATISVAGAISFLALAGAIGAANFLVLLALEATTMQTWGILMAIMSSQL